MRSPDLLLMGLLAAAIGSACGGNVVTGSGGAGAGAGGAATASSSGGSTTTTGTTGTTSGTGGAGGGILSCAQAPMDPGACPSGQKCMCGGPGGALVCECGAICTADTDCTDPAQPVCCGGGGGQVGTCTTACLCFCD